MKVIGITGGVGSGKSTVLELLKKNFNAYIIMADDVAKDTMMKDHVGYRKVVEIFGEDILNIDMSINRQKLAEIVFHNRNKLMVLNSIIHPLVKKMIIEKVNQIKCEGGYDYIFIESALLIEDHYEIICDELWYIHADESVRMDRLKLSREYSEEKIRMVFANQLTEDEFIRRCKHIIYNDRDIDYTMLQLQKILEG